MSEAESFWTTRPILAHILRLARTRRVGPWAVLGTAMARAVATIPPYVALPGTVGGRMSLNLFVALVGPSGAGKGGAEAAGATGIKFPEPHIDHVPLGSGEGASRTFRPWGTPAELPNPISSVIFTVPEIDTLTALMSRQGSTLSAELRKLYSGEGLGFANAGKDTRNVVAAHSYRACAIVGVQPLRSRALLAGADGGLPQRFIWLPTGDPAAPDERPSDPGCWKVPTAGWQRGHSGHLRLVDGHGDLAVPTSAQDMIDAHRLAVLRGDHGVDPLDGHAMLCRLKAAAALMALDARTAIEEDDWHLAGHVMEVSAVTRERCRRALTEHRRTENTARALAAVERDEIVAERKSQRARDAILRKLSRDNQLTTGELRRSLKVDIRDYYDAALTELLDSGDILVSPGTRGHRKVHVYYRYNCEQPSTSSHDIRCTAGTRVPEATAAASAGHSEQRGASDAHYRGCEQTGGAAATLMEVRVVQHRA